MTVNSQATTTAGAPPTSLVCVAVTKTVVVRHVVVRRGKTVTVVTHRTITVTRRVRVRHVKTVHGKKTVVFPYRIEVVRRCHTVTVSH